MSTLPINVLCAHVFIFARLYSRTRLKQNVLSTHHQISVFAFVAFVMDVMQSVRVHVRIVNAKTRANKQHSNAELEFSLLFDKEEEEEKQ